MKIQLDTTLKTIKVEESVKLSKFMDLVKKLLPNNEWKEFTLETHTVINHWGSPIVIEKEVYPRRWDEWQRPWITYCQSNLNMHNTSDDKNYQLNSGVYNIEAKV